MPFQDSPPPEGAPAVTQVRKSPRAGWLLLSPIALLALFAIGSRLINGATGMENGSASSGLEAGPPEKVEYVDAATQKQLEATVGGQLAALRHQDWAGALKFAELPVRNGFTQGQYQQIIQKSGFAIMLASSRQECRKALKAARLTTMLVTVRKPDGDGAGFVYRLVREGSDWRIQSCTHALDPDIASMPPLQYLRDTPQ